jgi:hypothetical protein
MAPALKSVYNAEYYCVITEYAFFMNEGGCPLVSVEFAVQGDLSLGALQRPENSTLRFAVAAGEGGGGGGGVCRLIHSQISQENGMKIVGKLTFARPIGACSFFFTYGSVGYSEVELPDKRVAR